VFYVGAHCSKPNLPFVSLSSALKYALGAAVVVGLGVEVVC